MFWAEIWKISEIFIWKFSVFGDEIFYYLNRRVFVMCPHLYAEKDVHCLDRQLVAEIFVCTAYWPWSKHSSDWARQPGCLRRLYIDKLFFCLSSMIYFIYLLSNCMRNKCRNSHITVWKWYSRALSKKKMILSVQARHLLLGSYWTS